MRMGSALNSKSKLRKTDAITIRLLILLNHSNAKKEISKNLVLVILLCLHVDLLQMDLEKILLMIVLHVSIQLLLIIIEFLVLMLLKFASKIKNALMAVASLCLMVTKTEIEKLVMEVKTVR